MEIAVRSRHLDISAELRDVAAEKASHLVRFLDGTQRGGGRLLSGPCGARRRLRVLRGRGGLSRPARPRARAGTKRSVALEAAINKEAHRLTRLKDRLVQRSRPRHGTVGQRSTEAPA